MNFDIGEVLSQEIAYSAHLCFQCPPAASDGLGLWDYNYPYEGGLWVSDSWSEATTSLANGTNLEEAA